MKPYQYERIVQEALSTPWAVTDGMAATIWELLRFRASGGRLTAEEIRARVGEAGDRPAPRTSGAVAVIPVHGVIAHRYFEASSGMTSADEISAMFRRALQSDDVGTILFDISSPGGTVAGVPELAAEIFAARDQKRIVAHANGLMASAAYWIGSQAHEVVMIKSGDVGSIGVYSLHEDWSGYLEKEGIKITALKFGDRKIEGAPWEPLDEEARAEFQSRVNAIGRDFQAAVARGRGVDVADVRRDFGDGRVFGAKEAKKRGLVDRVATFDETITRLTKGRGGGRRADTSVRQAPVAAEQAQADRDLLETTLAEMDCPPS